MNLLLIFIELLVVYSSLYVLYRKYRELGLYCWIVISLVLSMIMSLKMIEIFTFDVNLGFVLNTSIFLATNIIIHKKGIEELKKILLIIILTVTTTGIVLLLLGNTTISNLNIYSDLAFKYVFDNNIRIYIATICSLVFSVWFDAILYYLIRKDKNKIWISNIFTSIIAQFIDTILFIVILYINSIPFMEIIVFIIIRYILKLIVGSIGTVVIYLCNRIKEDD